MLANGVFVILLSVCLADSKSIIRFKFSEEGLLPRLRVVSFRIKDPRC